MEYILGGIYVKMGKIDEAICLLKSLSSKIAISHHPIPVSNIYIYIYGFIFHVA